MTTAKIYTKGLKLIGRGLFSKVYEKDSNTVLIISVDPIKEVMSYNWFPVCDMFPLINKIDYLESGEHVYEMKKYSRVSSLKKTLKPDQWELYKILKEIPVFNSKNIYDGYSFFYKEFEKLPESIRENMLEALNACSNWGSDVAFEISPRNVSVDNGNLILLDCFLIMSKARSVRSKKSGQKVW